MRFFCFLSLLAVVWSAPVEVRPECAACQLFSIAMMRNQVEENTISDVTLPLCSKLPNCDVTLTHCEIVRHLMIAAPTNVSSEKHHHFEKIHSHLQSVAEHCERDPHAEVLAGPPGPALCTMCFLVYYFFQFMNNGILQMPLLNLIPQVIQLTCIILSNVNNEITPPVCQALLADGAMPALLKAIADSMGSFYDLIAVQTMGCPTYQTLFGTC